MCTANGPQQLLPTLNRLTQSSCEPLVWVVGPYSAMGQCA